jgi:plasmid stabilization system protein ParE
MKIRYTKRAKIEIELAAQWYEQQRLNLGIDFLDNIENVLKNVSLFPYMFPKPYKNFHRCLVTKFPFSIFYTIEEKKIK